LSVCHFCCRLRRRLADTDCRRAHNATAVDSIADNAGIPRRRHGHGHGHRLAKHGHNLTFDTRYFLARPREEIACVGCKIVAVFGESVSVSVSVSASWNASLKQPPLHGAPQKYPYIRGRFAARVFHMSPSSVIWYRPFGWEGNCRPGGSNGSLPSGEWLTVTCGPTACTPGSAPGPTLGNEYWKT